MVDRMPSPEPLPIPSEQPGSRGKILEVAERLFASSGYAAVGMRELATLVGLSKSALFHHFPTKRDLYAAVLDGVMERIERSIDPMRLGDMSPRRALESWIDGIVTTLATEPPAGRLLMRALVEDEPFPAIRLTPGQTASRREGDGIGAEPMAFERRLEAILARCGELLERGVASGDFRALPRADALLNVIGATVFYFASGDVGEALIGESIFSTSAIERRREEIRTFVCRGLAA
jgi:AcrR family transcriptional regulator